MSSPATETGTPTGGSGRLESWKEIAAYLGRDVRTVQRWEKKEGLPVRRLQHDKLGTVYAYKSEIDEWREQRTSLPEEAAGNEANGHTDASAAESVETHVPAFRSARRTWLRVGAAVCLALVAVAAWIVRQVQMRPTTPPGRISIAVLPFTNLSGDPQQDYFTDGMTEELITQLGTLHGDRLHVIALASSMTYKHSDKTPRQIARELKVDYVLNGTVRRDGNRVRIAAHLVHASSDAALWNESYDRDLRDILGLQSEVADAIARSISLRLDTQTRRSRPVNPESYEGYLKGRFFWNKRTAEDLYRAIREFEAATQKDPEYAPAYVGLADCYALLGSAEMGALAPNAAMPKAKAAAAKALSLDAGLAEAHAAMAYVNLVYDWDWAAAEAEFKRAIALNPAYATAHQWYALYFNALGRTPEAIAELTTAQELDPRSPAIRSALSEAYYLGRQYDRAAAESKEALQLDPRFVLGYLTLARTYLYAGKPDEALAVFDQAKAVSAMTPAMSMFEADAWARKGDNGPALKMVSALMTARNTGYVPALYIAGLYTSMGDRAQAFHWLDQAFQERCEYLIYLNHDPMADTLRPDEHFRLLIEKLALPPGKI